MNSLPYPFLPSYKQKINEAGRTAQLNALVEAWGLTKTRRVIEKYGSVLDGIVQAYSLVPEELAKDIGRHNVDEDGDPIITDDENGDAP